jgi:hypothetical protein
MIRRGGSGKSMTEIRGDPLKILLEEVRGQSIEARVSEKQVSQ